MIRKRKNLASFGSYYWLLCLPSIKNGKRNILVLLGQKNSFLLFVYYSLFFYRPIYIYLYKLIPDSSPFQISYYYQHHRPSLQRNALDLNRYALGELMNSHAASSGLVCEEFLIYTVHFGEVCHISQEDLQRSTR